MEKSQKERLEQELRFLKDSLDSDVISNEEYEKGKERIEKKLKELGSKETEEGKEEIIVKEIREDEIKKEEIEEKKAEEKKPEEVKEKPEEVEEVKEEKEEEKKVEEEVKEEKKEEGEEEKTEEVEEKKPEIEIIEKEKKPIKINKKLLYGIAIIIILIIIYALIRGCRAEEILPACVSDEDCEMPGKVGFCIEPDTTEAKCEFKEPVDVPLTVLNDKNCESCDTTRMMQIIKLLFPGVKEEYIDYSSAEAEKLIDELSIDILPAYVFDQVITDTIRFDKFKRTLVKRNDNYILNPTASGANFYFKREKIANKLDLFVLPDTEASIKAEDNIKEVLDLFEDDIIFEKNIVTENQEEKLKEELGITSFPVFLINNQIKIGGVQSAEKIKDEFCNLNKLDKCKTTLSTAIK